MLLHQAAFFLIEGLHSIATDLHYWQGGTSLRHDLYRSIAIFASPKINHPRWKNL